MRDSSGPRRFGRVGKALLLTAVIGGLVGATAAVASARTTSESGGPGAMIVGGRPASQTYSFMVSLQSGGRHFCGGSLISPRWVVTAKHCVSGSNIGLRIGSKSTTSGGTVYKAIRTVRHPSVDLALLQTDRDVTEAPIAIAPSTAVGQSTRLIGWGQTCPTSGCGGAPTVLQELDTSLVADSRCGGINGPAEICVNNPGGNKGACYGDSGGPAVTPAAAGGWLLTGATSRSGGGARCATAPSIYEDVPANRQWIKSNSGV